MNKKKFIEIARKVNSLNNAIQSMLMEDPELREENFDLMQSKTDASTLFIITQANEMYSVNILDKSVMLNDKNISTARKICCYLLRRNTKMTLFEIAFRLNVSTCSQISHNLTWVTKKLETSYEISSKIEKAEEAIRKYYKDLIHNYE